MKTSALFRKIEALQGDTPWGHVLDAGTGHQSLGWVSELDTRQWTAVTAQPSIANSAGDVLGVPPRAQDRLLVGNWADDDFLAGETFDTVLLDYFIGAIDAFAPYYQESLIHRLVSCTSGTLYVTGLEPYVPVLADDEVGRFVGDLGRLRDACSLLARDRPYREFPANWVAAQLQRAGLTVTHLKHFKIRYRERFVDSQLAICEAHVDRLADTALASALRETIAATRERGYALISDYDGLPYGRDYVLRATARH